MSDETKWSPEPWEVYPAKYPGIDAANGEGVVFHSHDGEHHAGVWGGFDEGTDPGENARRIVACVNACKGLPTEALEAGALAKALDTLVEAQSFASGVSIASEVDHSEWSMHRGMGGVIRDRCYAALRALGRLK